jgi:hypothetical protein
MPVVVLLVIGAMLLWFATPASWIVFGAIAWLCLWLLFGNARRGRRMRRAQRRAARRAAAQNAVFDQAPIAPPPPIPGPLPPPPQPAVDLSTSRLPAEVGKQVDRIQRKAAKLGEHPDRFPIGSKDLYVVQHTASDYLPTTVRTFLEVPAWSVETPTADGRTPLQMLTSQLDMLEAKLDEIHEQVSKQRVDNLLANERFLEQNFGGSEAEELTLPH